MTDETHKESLARVRRRIYAAVEKFCNDRLTIGRPEFHMAELDAMVRETVTCPVAPESVGRILRDLRQSKRINYLLLSRRQSKYQVLPAQLDLL